jgi:DNA-binding transcriptional ArsR family regulator
MTVAVDRSLTALADPTRRALLGRLAHGPRRAGELAEGFPMSRPAVCKHLRVLKEAGLVKARKQGRKQVYRLAPPQGVEEARKVVEEVSRFWDIALQSFKRYAEEER